MKKFFKIFFPIIAFLLIFLTFVKVDYFSKTKDSSILEITPTKTIINSGGSEVDRDSLLKIEWIEINDTNKIQLYSNLSKKETTNTLATLRNCESLISAGFYTKEGNHIGYFFSEYKKYGNTTENSFYNGYFSVYNDKKASISRYTPENERLSLQSGPLLIFEGKIEKLNLETDEPARRVVVATSSESNKIYFFIVYSSQNHILGPKLMDLPETIKKVSDKNDLGIKSALNLDGGSHSAIISRGIKIVELSNIGGYFCINP